ncbi:hypothetical protein [Halopiger goleimassiliensis]|uniref:hypothetical protein n=1 Tax=Halopiger goleimassiliensis TaxID=1293048 RepID=UPI000677AEB4|nr:hypothetical protein [Halopiger goleimassiliensis]
MNDDANSDGVSVAEFVEYCRIQAGLLSGQVERMGEEADDLLAEIDERVSEIRARLEDHRNAVAGTESPESAGGPDADVDVAELETLQDELEETQSVVEAKQARMQAFQDLAAGYTDLAEELESSVEDDATAFQRVVQFEADNDAPAYFQEQDRQTLVEAAAEAADEDDGEDA